MKTHLTIWQDWQRQAFALQEAQLRAFKHGEGALHQGVEWMNQGLAFHRGLTDMALRQLRLTQDWMKLWGLI